MVVTAVVVATVGGSAVTGIVRAAAELAAPDDKGFVEKSALLEVRD